MNLDLARTPAYVCDKGLLLKNLHILRKVQEETGCKILLALKGFAMWSFFPLISRYLAGITASSLDEALLGHEEFEGEVHVCVPAIRDSDLPKFMDLADHIVFNSFSQWERFRDRIKVSRKKLSCGIRVNPEYSEVLVDKYNPCVRHSRLGVTRGQFRDDLLEGIEGLHFHSMCEQNADTLARTVGVVEEKFGDLLGRMQWVNFGGGHHITRADYDVALLCDVIRGFRQRHGVMVYLEPGEAVALNIGFLVASVLDIVHNGVDIAILDTSAAAHMPDVLEMPYRPEIVGAGQPGEFPHTYLLGGNSCLAGDVIGEYSFPNPLEVGSRIVFCDMAHYSMVKNNTFNGIHLPSIAIYDPETGNIETVRSFTHEDYKFRLS